MRNIITVKNGDSMGAKPTYDSTDVSLYRGSLNFFKAADIIVSSDEACPPDSFGFLVSHGLELALKAYLIKCGLDEDMLKDEVGHSLVKAWNRCVALGLPLDKRVPRWCDLLDRAHSRPYLFRYARANTGTVTSPQSELHSGLDNVLNVVGAELGMDRDGNFV